MQKSMAELFKNADGQGAIGLVEWATQGGGQGELLAPALFKAFAIMQAFKVFDKDGFISAADLRQTRTERGQDLAEEEVTEMIQGADTDGDGLVSPAEFAVMMGKGDA